MGWRFGRSVRVLLGVRIVVVLTLAFMVASCGGSPNAAGDGTGPGDSLGAANLIAQGWFEPPLR
jgi:hypothetical protein